MDTFPPPTGAPRHAERTSRFTMVMLAWLKPTGAARMAAFREQARPLFAKYDLRVERQLMISGEGQIVGENRFEQPDIIAIAHRRHVRQLEIKCIRCRTWQPRPPSNGGFAQILVLCSLLTAALVNAKQGGRNFKALDRVVQGEIIAGSAVRRVFAAIRTTIWKPVSSRLTNWSS